MAALSEMGISAAAHGKQLLALGFTVDQVVHDYGDLCQAITDEEVRAVSGAPARQRTFSVAAFVADAEQVASLHASARGCSLVVSAVDPLLHAKGDRDLLMASLVNLVHNAFKFTHAGTQVSLDVRSTQSAVYIEVEDHCGGLPPGSSEVMFLPFTQNGGDRSGLGFGLSIARRHIEADGGELTVRNLPGQGCVFTMSLPLQSP
ncbi:sensor histidine kinase [Piscinibacter terrae]|uniref:sensor histidine kinase n=1 Tax=Piscinibacter terrae TaxID=2496871 RepID=UPI001F1FA723|nr:HAMP domain-containing sensor histidine kinase [Albitalea terrae]